MSTLTTIPRDPVKGIGGISYVLLANYSDVVGTTDDSSGNTTFAVDDSVEPVVTIDSLFTKFVMTKESSNWTETGTGSAAQASTFYNQVLTMVFGRNDTLKRNAIKTMGVSELVAVVVQRDGTAIALGINNGLDMSSSTGTSGTAPGDLSGSTIVLSGNESDPYGIVAVEQLALLLEAPAEG